MRVLITGINGRIGQYVAKDLLGQKLEVIGLDVAEKINHTLEVCSYIKADITNKEGLKKALKGHNIDAVIHLAALAHFTSSNYSLEDFMETNLRGALNVAEAAYVCGAELFLFSSTIDVFGQVDGGYADENSLCNPITNYGRSKYAAETALRKFLQPLNIDYYIFRFAPVYFPSNTKDLDKRVLLPKQLGAFYFDTGSYRFSLCSVLNVVNAIRAFITRRIEPGLYIVSDQSALSAREIVDIKKKNGEVKFVVRFSYASVSFCVAIISWVLERFKQLEKGLLITNLNKVAKPVFYDSSKLARKVTLQWNIINTLYKYE